MKFSLSQIEHEIISLVKGFVNSDQSFYEKSNKLSDDEAQNIEKELRKLGYIN